MNHSVATCLIAVAIASTLSSSYVGSQEVSSRYELFPTPLNWTEAHKDCKYWDGQLALPLSPEEAQTLIDLMGTNSTAEIHVGFNDVLQEGNYRTNWGQSISEIGYHQWDPDQAEGPDANCGSFTIETTQGLRSIPCSNELPYICQYPLWRDEYVVAYGFGWFKLHNITANWATAWETCRSEDAYLAVVRSKEEVDALQKQYGEFIDGPIHYGAHHKYSNHKFVTIFDEPLEDSYSIWYPGFPGTFTNEESPVVNLVMSNAWTANGLLLNSASDQLAFLCKQDMHFN